MGVSFEICIFYVGLLFAFCLIRCLPLKLKAISIIALLALAAGYVIQFVGYTVNGISLKSTIFTIIFSYSAKQGKLRLYFP